MWLGVSIRVRGWEAAAAAAEAEAEAEAEGRQRLPRRQLRAAEEVSIGPAVLGRGDCTVTGFSGCRGGGGGGGGGRCRMAVAAAAGAAAAAEEGRERGTNNAHTRRGYTQPANVWKGPQRP